jgi:hypothetical protein
MVSILNETRSTDAFIATILALHRAKVDGKLVVPAIIRNAERLKLFADTDPNKEGTTHQQILMKSVMLLISKGKTKVRAAQKSGSVPDVLAGDAVGACSGGAIGACPGVATGSHSSSDPSTRMEQLLSKSEDLRKLKEEWRKWWESDQPGHLHYQRVHGGVGP